MTERRPPSDAVTEPTPEDVVRGYYASNGPRFADFVEDTRRWLHEDVIWIDRNRPDGHRGREAVIAELQRAHALGIEYMSFDVLTLVATGEVVLTHRVDKLHAADGAVLAELDMMGYNKVQNHQIVYGKDYHFETAAYDATWVGQDHSRGEPRGPSVQ